MWRGPWWQNETQNTKGKGTQSFRCLSTYWKDQSSEIPGPWDQWACLKQRWLSLRKGHLNWTCVSLWNLVGTHEHCGSYFLPLQGHSRSSLKGHDNQDTFLRTGREQMSPLSSGRKSKKEDPLTDPGKDDDCEFELLACTFKGKIMFN